MKKVIVFLLLLIICISCSKNENIVRVGVILPLTGQMSKYGKTSEAALTSMLEILNKERLDNNKPLLKLIIEDDKLESQAGVSALNKLINVDKVSVVIGSMASSITLAMAPIAESKKVVLISPGSSNPKITESGDFIFRTVLSDDFEGAVAANIYKNNFHGQPLGILYINNDYGIGLKEVFKRNLDSKIKTFEFPYSTDEKNFRSLLSKIKNSQCQVVYLIGYYEMIQIFQQAKELNLKINWIGTNQLNDESLVKQLSNNSRGTIFPAWRFNLDEIKKKNSSFYKKYLELSNGLDIDIFAANAVDALLVLDKVIQSSDLDGKYIRDKILTVKNFEGITGQFSFDEKGDVMKELDIKRIQDGKIIDN